jgi:hypothetical protein
MDITTYVLVKEFTTAVVNKQAGYQLELPEYTGKLDEDALNKIAESIQTSIILDGKLYKLSRITGTEYKYVNLTTDGRETVVSMTELDIHKETGEFSTRRLITDQSEVGELRQEFEAHRDDEVRHITAEEREYCNNKVTAEVTKDGPNYKLNLIK